jgi:hypothetical protein
MVNVQWTKTKYDADAVYRKESAREPQVAGRLPG